MSLLIYNYKHHQNPRNIPLNSIKFISSECNSKKAMKKMVSTTDSFLQWHCVYDYTIPQCKEYGTWNQIIFIKLAKHPTQRSHSKTHWIRIEILQTKHEAWGCFKLNNTPLYNKKWVLVFFPTWNYNQYIQKKNVYMQIFYVQMSNSTVVQ